MKQNQIQDILQNKDRIRFRDVFLAMHGFDRAQIIEGISVEDFDEVLKYLSAAEVAEFIPFLEASSSINAFEQMSEIFALRVLQQMNFDDAVDILEEFSEDERNKYLNMLSVEEFNEFKQFLSYNSESAGALMSNSYIELDSNLEIKAAMKYVISKASDVEVINVLYVVENEKLIGVLSLRELIVARASQKLTDVMSKNIILSYYDEDNEDVAQKVKDYDLNALPVIDYDNNLLGVITVDDVIDVIEEIASEDYAKMAGLSAIVEDSRRESVFIDIKNRLPWLLILLGVGCFTAFMMANFENTLAQVTILTFFLPLILSMAGNTGTQSLAVTIRYITSDKFESKQDIISHLWKEVRIGFLNGVCIATVVFLLLNVIGYFANLDNTLIISLVVSASIIVTLTVSTLSGSLIPLVITFFGGDAAVASGPFISTINDIIAITIYLVLATVFLLPFV